MAFSRPDGQVTGSPGRKLVRRARAYCHRVGDTGHISNFVLSYWCFFSSARRTPTLHEKYVKELGRNVRLRGFHPVRKISWSMQLGMPE